MNDFNALLTRVRYCTICAVDLPLGPRPIVRGTPDAKLLLIGQAPGTRVHESGVPWNDPSGERLRDWLQMTSDDFYDESKIANVPMGFCYSGADAKGGDKQPHPKCAPEWHPPLACWFAECRIDDLDRTVRAETLSRKTKNPWFAVEVLPMLRERVAGLFG